MSTFPTWLRPKQSICIQPKRSSGLAILAYAQLGLLAIGRHADLRLGTGENVHRVADRSRKQVVARETAHNRVEAVEHSGCSKVERAYSALPAGKPRGLMSHMAV